VSALSRQRVAKAFGNVLRLARANAGISHEELAERAKCDRTYPSLLERGLRQPTLTVLIEAGNALHVEPAKLLADTLARLRSEAKR
jgi:transcriptional regulator with XRE-family HTH domain